MVANAAPDNSIETGRDNVGMSGELMVANAAPDYI